MAAQNSQGIQKLLEAEKEASMIVEKARQYRVDRLKAARTEAAKEIEALKEQKNLEFKAFEAELDAETEIKLESIQMAFKDNKDSVIDKLLSTITTVQPKVHMNFKINED
ncbi:18394_t:CDS:2 [Entrophospora sp. SA101]|nr:4959_t:CDS:2 [Entrophospora candida]CAJ0633374.1 3794_t:CDS:2 [Entrophospora sp. SA101]CAJ0757997.1 18394_t:CDS:2 [Entrophospora sp. SA101]CAJ0840696.1 4460_t:CDS:2 [Entrophospora sp. SA101]CAJ0864865.1 15329_t:CDS:2 [Entrophospora sp. SA101]